MRPHLITTPPVAKTCENCGRWVLTGIAEGLKATVDLTTLDVSQQIQAILARTQLYWVTRTGLVHLDHYRAKGTSRHPVAPEHRHRVRWTQNGPAAQPPPPALPGDFPPY